MYAVCQREINALKKCNSPFIVKLLGEEIITTANNGNEALLLLEYCSGGTLFEIVVARNGNSLPCSQAYRIFNQIIAAVLHLHAHDIPVTHRDLKLENVLFGNDSNIRLCDFGSCVTGRAGTQIHLLPNFKP